MPNGVAHLPSTQRDTKVMIARTFAKDHSVPIPMAVKWSRYWAATLAAIGTNDSPIFYFKQ